MKHWKIGLVIVITALIALLVSFTQTRRHQTEWRSYNGGAENTHFSTLRQINRDNVKQLAVAWTYDTNDAFDGSEMQCNPIIANGLLYATSPKMRVFALDAATGKERWSFDPNFGQKALGKSRNRGLTYWDGEGQPRIYFGFRNLLYAVDALTGKVIESFGDNGKIDLREGLGRPAQDLSVGLTTPGIIYKDLIILGSLVSETLPAAPGDIRAYDLRTGKPRWTFHTIPHPGEFGYETWPKDAWQYIGGVNDWSGMALDEQRGLLFAPTGSATYDFYGANRPGDNLFANSLLCLDATTGQRKWHFQTVRHDLWDRDLPSAPTLVTIKREGKLIDAVAQTTKAGYVFVFERETGKPLYPIEYQKVSTDVVDGELAADTQPIPVSPPPIARQTMTEENLTTRTPEAHADVLKRFLKLRSKNHYEPPSKEGTIVTPGFDGGPGWGGAAYDPASGFLIVNSNEVPCIAKIIDRPMKTAQATARNIYDRNCASCHSKDLSGTPPEFPSLIGLQKKYNENQTLTIIRNGAGRMPGFGGSMSAESLQAVTKFLLTGEDSNIANDHSKPSNIDQKYMMEGYPRFLDPDGYPAIKPPWGTLNAIDLNKGTIAWQIPFGEYPELLAKGIRDTGSWNYGGPITTAGGLIFIGATNYDRKFRAFDVRNGKLLWENVMPFAGNATPMTYQVNGKQFVVIAAGGGKRGAPSGGTYVAFALPQK